MFESADESPLEPKPKRKKSLARRAALIVAATLVALFFFEMTLRLAGTLILHDLPPAASNGLPEYTIVCIGDSWTHGLQWSPYPKILGEKLNSSQSQTSYRVLNLGVPENNSSQVLRRLNSHLAEKGPPQMVVVLVGNNDFQNLAESSYWTFQDTAEDQSRIHAARARVALHSLRIFKLADLVVRKVSGLETTDQFFLAEPDQQGQGQEILRPVALDLATHDRQLNYNLVKIIELSKRYDFQLVMMTYFHFHGHKVNQTIIDVASRYEIPLVNNTMRFHERIPEAQQGAYYYGGHATSLGNELIADHLLEVLESLEIDLPNFDLATSRQQEIP